MRRYILSALLSIRPKGKSGQSGCSMTEVSLMSGDDAGGGDDPEDKRWWV